MAPWIRAIIPREMIWDSDNGRFDNMAMQEVIHTENLTKDFGFVRAVDNLSLNVRRGKSVGFLGPNGSGKSTTIKMMTNLINATSGSAYLMGIDVRKQPRKALANVGAIVEVPEFYPYLTPTETFNYLGKIRGMRTAEIKRKSDELLRMVRLLEWRDSRIGKFSKGMKQRLAIAQALLHEPEILILDEPTTGLDPRGMVEIREILRQLKAEGYTLFMSSHLLPEVQEICDSVAMIDNGKILVYDSVENLSRIAVMNQIEVDLAEAPSDESLGRIARFEGVKDIKNPNPLKISIEYTGETNSRHQLLQEMLAAGMKVLSFNPHGLPLENLYMQLVKESR